MNVDHSLPLEYSTDQNQLNILGFWIFIGAEIMLFATLFRLLFHISRPDRKWACRRGDI